MSHASSRIQCPQCQAPLKLVVAGPGERQTCPRCGTAFLPPAPTPAPASAAPGDDWEDLFDSPPAPAARSTPKPPHSAPSSPSNSPASTSGSPQPPPSSSPETPTPDAGLKLDPLDPLEPVAPSPAPVAAPAAEEDDDEFRLAPPTPLPPAVAFRSPHALPAGSTPDGSSPAPQSSPAPGRSGGPIVPPAARRPDSAAAPVVGAAPLPVAQPAGRYTFALACPVCATRVDCLSTQIGQTMRCPDCHSDIAIRPPLAHERRTPVDQNPLALDPQRELAPRPEPTPDVRAQEADLLRSNAASLLERAKREQEEIDERHAATLDDTHAADLFRFLLDPGAIARMIILGALSAALLVAIRWTAPMFGPAGGSILGVFFLAFSAMLTGIWFAAFSAHGLALFRDSSFGNAKVDWPEVQFLDWIGECLYPLVALIFAGLPGALLASALRSFEAPWVLQLLALLASWTALFPLTFLSMMHEVSLGSIVSPAVYRSLGEQRGPWIVFYQATVLLALVLLGCTLVALADSLIVVPLVAAAVTLIGLFYARLLGWLASRIAPSLADSTDDEADDDDAGNGADDRGNAERPVDRRPPHGPAAP